MGNQKQKWTQDEEDALIAGVEKHGPGKWKNILKDPQFAPFLTSRSNIDLKVTPFFVLPPLSHYIRVRVRVMVLTIVPPSSG